MIDETWPPHVLAAYARLLEARRAGLAKEGAYRLLSYNDFVLYLKPHTDGVAGQICSWGVRYPLLVRPTEAEVIAAAEAQFA